MNYTVAKVTQDCDFTESAQRPIRVAKRELSNVTYYLRVTEQDINLDVYEKLFDTQRNIKTTPVYVKELSEGGGEGDESSPRGCVWFRRYNVFRGLWEHGGSSHRSHKRA